MKKLRSVRMEVKTNQTSNKMRRRRIRIRNLRIMMRTKFKLVIKSMSKVSMRRVSKIESLERLYFAKHVTKARIFLEV